MINWLVVEPPLWKIWKSIGMKTFPIYGKIKNVPNYKRDNIWVNIWIIYGESMDHLWIWLVVEPPSEKYEWKTVGMMTFPLELKKWKSCSKPPTSHGEWWINVNHHSRKKYIYEISAQISILVPLLAIISVIMIIVMIMSLACYCIRVSPMFAAAKPHRKLTVTNSFYGVYMFLHFFTIGNQQISKGQPGNSPSKSVKRKILHWYF